MFAGLANGQLSVLSEIAAMVQQQFKELIKTHIVLPTSETIPLAEEISVLIDENQKMHQHFKINEPTAVLIRPDKYVGLTQLPVNKDELLSYMESSYLNLSSKG